MGLVDGDLDVRFHKNYPYMGEKVSYYRARTCGANETIPELKAMACRDIGCRLQASVA